MVLYIYSAEVLLVLIACSDILNLQCRRAAWILASSCNFEELRNITALALAKRWPIGEQQWPYQNHGETNAGLNFLECIEQKPHRNSQHLPLHKDLWRILYVLAVVSIPSTMCDMAVYFGSLYDCYLFAYRFKRARNSCLLANSYIKCLRVVGNYETDNLKCSFLGRVLFSVTLIIIFLRFILNLLCFLQHSLFCNPG